MFCANCGRPLNDPMSIDRGIGPHCWDHIDPAWHASISQRLGETEKARNEHRRTMTRTTGTA